MILKRQAEGISVAKAGPDAKEKYAGRKASIDRDVITNMIKAGSSLTSMCPPHQSRAGVVILVR